MNKNNPYHCMILGHSIDAITSAVVLASLGNTVKMVAQVDKLNDTLMKYEFEYHVLALWKLYLQNNLIITSSFSNFDSVLDVPDNVEAIWCFTDNFSTYYNEVSSSDIEEMFITSVNASQNQKTAYIFSGKNQIGYFNDISTKIHRPWVYYVPFVFLQDGHTYASMMNPSLWLLGEKTPNSWQHLTILQPFKQNALQTDINDILTIEFARSSIMGMLATRVSYMNEMSRLADAKGIDITEIRHIMGLDKRIGASYLQAGWGFGGRTLPAEVACLEQSFVQTNTDIQLVSAVSAINDDQKELIFRKFWQFFDGLIENKTVMIWGASYKAGSGRTLESAIHPLLKLLWSYNIKTLVCADKATNELQNLYGDENRLAFVDTPYDQLANVQAIFLINWDFEQSPNVSRINEVAVPLFDSQNVLNRTEIKQLIGGYVGIGKGYS